MCWRRRQVRFVGMSICMKAPHIRISTSMMAAVFLVQRELRCERRTGAAMWQRAFSCPAARDIATAAARHGTFRGF